MSDLRTTPVRPYAFPAMAKLDESQLAADRARQEQLETVLNDAIAKGIAQGVAQGRLEAQTEAQLLLEQSRREGLERGHAEGLEEMRQAANALREALAEFEVQRTQIISEAEGFCVDLCPRDCRAAGRRRQPARGIRGALSEVRSQGARAGKSVRDFLKSESQQARSGGDRRSSAARR